jgi:hypothetical protein
MNTSVRSFLLAPLVLILLGAFAVPAQATTRVQYDDKVRDAPASLDIVRATGTYDTKTINVRIRVRNLFKTGRVTIGAGVSGWGYNYIIAKGKHSVTKRVHGYSEVDDLGSHPCPGIRVSWRPVSNIIVAHLPISCTGSRAFSEDDVRFGGVDFRRSGHLDRVGSVYYHP